VYSVTVKVLVCGSRKWLNQKAIERELRKLPAGTTIIHGGAPGADNIAGYVAKKLGFTVRAYAADWEGLGKKAGPVRNRTMLTNENLPHDPIHKALAFHEDPGLGKGTRDMVSLLELAKIPVERFAA
jgi:hypothetical protein